MKAFYSPVATSNVLRSPRIVGIPAIFALSLLRMTTAHAQTCEEEKLRVEEANPDTTIVCEERATSGGDTSSEGANDDPGTSAHTSAGHGGGSGRHVGPEYLVEPKAIQFKQCPGNSQQSYCTTIRFVGGDPPAYIEVGVTVTAPVVLRDGKRLSSFEAQLDSASAATTTAFYYIGRLQAGKANVTEVSAGFASWMDKTMRTHSIGYRVQQCSPVKSPPEPC